MGVLSVLWSIFGMIVVVFAVLSLAVGGFLLMIDEEFFFAIAAWLADVGLILYVATEIVKAL